MHCWKFALFLTACLPAAGCCLCAHPHDCCGPVCGQEHYSFARRGSAFSDLPPQEYEFVGQEAEDLPPMDLPGEAMPTPAPPPPRGNDGAGGRSTSRSAIRRPGNGRGRPSR